MGMGCCFPKFSMFHSSQGTANRLTLLSISQQIVAKVAKQGVQM